MSLVGELYSKIEDGREGKNIGLKTGLLKLDFYTGGFKKGVYKLIFSKSSVGRILMISNADICVLKIIILPSLKVILEIMIG